MVDAVEENISEDGDPRPAHPRTAVHHDRAGRLVDVPDAGHGVEEGGGGVWHAVVPPVRHMVLTHDPLLRHVIDSGQLELPQGEGLKCLLPQDIDLPLIKDLTARVWPVSCTLHLASFLQACQHHNNVNMMFPDNRPEITDGAILGTL